MTTLKTLQSDIELRLTRGKPSDDFELDKRQIQHWLIITRDAMVANDQSQRIRAGLGIDKTYLVTDSCNVVINEDSTCTTDDCFDKYYVEAPFDILKLDEDKGLYHVTNHDNYEIHQIDQSAFDVIRKLKFAKPSVDNITFMREGSKRLYIQGIKPKSRQFIQINITYIPTLQSQTITEDDEFPIASDLVAPLLDAVEEIARRELDIRNIDDDTNDGDQDDA